MTKLKKLNHNRILFKYNKNKMMIINQSHRKNIENIDIQKNPLLNKIYHKMMMYNRIINSLFNLE